jgi:zinc transport system substrate-binding protein
METISTKSWRKQMQKAILTATFTIVLGLFSVCSWAAEISGPTVVVSIKPLQALVAGVMLGVAEPQLLVKGGASPHDYILRPSDARAIAQADLIVWVGHSLENFLEKPLSTLGHRAHQLELTEKLASQLVPLREGGSWEAHAHHHDDHPGEQHQEHHEPGELELNPHLWLSPLLAKRIVTEIAATLSEIDPAHQAIYHTNSERMNRRLDELHLQLKTKLEPVRGVPYVVFHDAYQYFETAYGLNAVGSVTIDPERKVGVKRVREIRAKIKELHARCVFSEPQFKPQLVATIIEGTGARTGVLDPLGADLPAGPESYFQLLINLADNLLRGLR